MSKIHEFYLIYVKTQDARSPWKFSSIGGRASFCYSAVRHIRKIDGNIKGTPTTPWCCPMSLATDFIVVRQPQAPTSCISFGFYRCPPTSGPYVLHLFRVLSLPANLRPLRLASDRILGVSHTSGVTSAFLFTVYSICTSMAMAFQSNQSSSLPWSQPRER